MRIHKLLNIHSYFLFLTDNERQSFALSMKRIGESNTVLYTCNNTFGQNETTWLTSGYLRYLLNLIQGHCRKVYLIQGHYRKVNSRSHHDVAYL